MKKIFLLLIFGIFFVSLVSSLGLQLCVDHIPPSAVSNLSAVVSGNNIKLNWEAATDKPPCSGISHYDIYKSFNGGSFAYLNYTIGTTYTLSGLPLGSYSYVIHSIDLAGHNEGNGKIVTAIVGGNSNNGAISGGGGGGGTSKAIYKCESWGSCENGFKYRTCVDSTGKYQNITESKFCVINLSNQLNSTNLSSNNTTNSSNNTNKKFSSKTSGITGSVIAGFGSFAKSPSGSAILVLLFIALFIFSIKFFKKKKR